MHSHIFHFTLGQNRHIGWANHKAFELAGINEDTKDPEGGYYERDPDTNKLTGKFMEPESIKQVIACAPPPTYNEWRKAIINQWQQYSNCGFTTVAELLFIPNWYDYLDKAVEDTALEPNCPLRMVIYKYVDSIEESPEDGESPLDGESPPGKNHSIHENDKLWFAGVKIVSDGSPHCGTVASREPFLENDLTRKLGFPPSPNYGKLNFSEEYLHKLVKHFHDKGKQVAIHAHGERAIEQVLRVYEKVRIFS